MLQRHLVLWRRVRLSYARNASKDYAAFTVGYLRASFLDQHSYPGSKGTPSVRASNETDVGKNGENRRFWNNKSLHLGKDRRLTATMEY